MVGGICWFFGEISLFSQWSMRLGTWGILACLGLGAICDGSVTFNAVFTAQAELDFTEAEKAMFEDGLDFWSQVITGYRDGVDREWALTIDSFDSEPTTEGLISLGDNPGSESLAGLDSDPGDGAESPVVLSGPNAGELLDDELMTGLLTGSGYLSDTTLGSLYDIGFTVSRPLIGVPEPSSGVLVLSGCLLGLRRKR